MKPFETVDHTADLALVVRGATLAELLQNAASGMFSQIADLSAERPSRGEHRWSLEGEEPEELLMAWLRELLFEHETEGLVFTDFSVAVEGQYELQATARAGGLRGDEPLTAIKAVTYHDLRIERLGDHWQVKIVFDL